ncbi:hypothetical protein VFPPC_13115 [Pochonia chlamydosporia 170]|uniref:Uncharacterized protein n=1 Tax=Pochonia chlamydosporia 170 TaxID=1380566 RepID=A0A179G9Z8_METCM|nr:hypothetical protein VFPPC_13115 [Pochonia chlamydosporia 170]OAQ73979.1 hypothetical protein VFPPC_13115 [Pochonia chlamydosporia 170]
MAFKTAAAMLLDQIATVLDWDGKLELPGAEVRVNCEGRCTLEWSTRQDDSCPSHTMYWDDTNPGYIRVTSIQHNKIIAPRTPGPRRLCFRVPTYTDGGMRRALNRAMKNLGMSKKLRDEAGIRLVEKTENTPEHAVWVLTRIPVYDEED